MIAYFRAYCLSLKANMLDSAFKLANILLSQIVCFFYLETIFDNIPKLAEFTYAELVLVYGFYLVTKGCADLFSNNLYSLEKYIKKGKLDLYYIKPNSILAQLLIENVDITQFINIIVGGIIIARSLTNVDNLAFKLGASAVLTIIGIVVIFSVKLLSMSIAFWTFSSYPIAITVNNCCEFARYPINIYGNVLRRFFTLIFPLSFISFFQLEIIRPSENICVDVILGTVATLVLLLISLLTWKNGLNRYQSGGQ